MSITADIDHEGGTTAEWTSVTTTDADLSVSAGAALAGTGYGLSVLINDNTVDYARFNLAKQTTVRGRFYFDPNSITMGNGEKFVIFKLLQTAVTYYGIVLFGLRYLTVSGYELSSYYGIDTGALTEDIALLTDAPHYIEWKMVQAASTSSNDGTYQWWLDGVDQGEVTGLDNYNLMVDQDWRLLLGVPDTDIDAGTSGTIFFDQLIVNNDGGLIGPHGVVYVPRYGFILHNDPGMV